MRVRVGVLVASLVTSVLAFGSPTVADTSSTTAPTSTAGTAPSSTQASSTTVASEPSTATTVAGDGSSTTTATTTATSTSATTETTATTATTIADCPTDPGATTTTVDESTTTTISPDCAPPTTAAPDTTAPSSTAPGGAIDVGAAPAPPSGGSTVGPATPGAGPPVRGTQVQTRPIPPKPTTTTTTTTTTLPTYGLPWNSGSGRRVVYSKSRQRVWVVDSNGVVIKTHLVSGRQTPLDPRPGNYRVWSRSRYTHSIANPSITWGFMVRFAWGARGGNIGFHEIPFQYGQPVQSIWQLGQPLSGGCVRQARPDAIWMWNWAQIGTRVVVLG